MSNDTATRVRDALEAKADSLVPHLDSHIDPPAWAALAEAPETSTTGHSHRRLAPLAAAITVAAVVGGIATWRAVNDDPVERRPATTVTSAATTPTPSPSDYACQALSIEVVAGDGGVTPVAITRNVVQHVSVAAPARVTAHIRPGCRASAQLLNDPIPDGVDVQTQVVAPVTPNEWKLDHEGQYRLTVAVGMCDLGPTTNPGCIGGVAVLAAVIITVTQ